MQKILFPLLIAANIFSFQANAERLLRCNTPMGSNLQEIEITRENGVIKLNELNMDGWRSTPRVISSQAWAAKDIRWHSKDDGSARLYLTKDQGGQSWFYVATSLDTKVIGDCERTD